MQDSLLQFGQYHHLYDKVAGPRHVKASVTLLIEPASKFEFISQVDWPANANYDEFIRFSCYDTLFTHQHSHRAIAVKLTLVAVGFYEEASSPFAFQKAAEEAIKQAL